MKSKVLKRVLLAVLLATGLLGYGQTEGSEEVIRRYETGVVTSTQRQVEYRHHSAAPFPAKPGQELLLGDSLATLALSRATVELQSHSMLRMQEWTRLLLLTNSPTSALKGGRLGKTVSSRPGAQHLPAVFLQYGGVHFSPKSEAQEIPILVPLAVATPKGTEFSVRMDPDANLAVFDMFDGEVEVSNEFGSVTVTNGWQAVVQAGRAPQAFRIEAKKLVQWWLYYPAVLDPEEIAATTSTHVSIQASLNAYTAGDLPLALSSYPDSANAVAPSTDTQRAYLASLLLSAGAVSRATDLMKGGQPDNPALHAVRTMIDAVATPSESPFSDGTARASQTSPTWFSTAEAHTASEWLAASYERQSQGALDEALLCARRAVERSPRFAYAWARVAELEFSHGRTEAALRAVQQALRLGPRNAEAHAVHGFLLAAANRTREAMQAFEEAITLNPALANGWLGRGLCRIRQGHLDSGRRDLRTATSLEPRRSLLRSYAAKAFADAGAFRFANQELDYAKSLDPLDPTPWLYEALVRQSENRINEGIAELEQSLALNANRAVYRSDFLLDQDSAVRGANLARLYADAGMADLSVREASRALNRDYASATAHLFLADSYDQMRDPRQVNLRYETPWFSEFLLANLLAPVGAGTVSPSVSRGDYSRLFERDTLGVASQTVWTSNGDWLESASQFGRVDNFEYAVDGLYRHEVGQRPNNELEQLTLGFKTKYQVGASDTLYLQAISYDADSGDLAQYYDQADADPRLQVHESQKPILVAGWHHEWQPGVHTLAFVAPWNIEAVTRNPLYRTPIGALLPDGSVSLIPSARLPFLPLDYSTRYSGCSVEAQQIWELKTHTLTAGVRLQSGNLDSQADLNVGAVYGDFPGQSMVRDYGGSTGMERLSAYAYDHWQFCSWALLTAGLSYDLLREPVNFALPPLTDEEDHQSQLSPKVGLTLTPWKGGTVRGAYAQSLGGISHEQSLRLEPVQVAGFTQVYRGLMPESLVGLVGGQEIELWGASVEQRLPTRTWLALSGEQLHSAAKRSQGFFVDDPDLAAIIPSTLGQSLNYQEDTVRLTANQLVGNSLGLLAAYEVSRASLDAAYGKVAGSASSQRAVLQQLHLGMKVNHPLGGFLRWDSTWTKQSDFDFDPVAPQPEMGDAFWQHNVWLGWRFLHRHAELALGLLNLTDQDYQLHPLNPYPETYRGRTVAVSAAFTF